MEKRKLRKLVSTRYKFECLAIKHEDRYMIKYETIGFIIIEKRDRKYAMKEARRILGRRIDNVRLISKIQTERVLSQCHPEIQALIDKYGETIETEEIICKE